MNGVFYKIFICIKNCKQGFTNKYLYKLTICGIAVYSEGKIIYGKKTTVEECAIFESEENLIQEYVLNKGVFHNYALNVGL